MATGTLPPPTTSGLRVIDADTHITEPADLWTSRAPRAWADRVPQVRTIDGVRWWTMDGEAISRAGAQAVIRPDGSKARGAGFTEWTIDDAHPAAYDVEARLAVMDRLGVWAHVVYPNVAGFGGQRFSRVNDVEARRLVVTLFNDAMAEMQERSGGRLLPMAAVPWWDVDASVAEARRAAELGLHGVVMCSDPQNRGAADLGERAWDPFWEACCELGLPVNFHIGASDTQSDWFGSSPWPSLDADRKLAVGSSMIIMGNARVLANLIFAGVLERFPELQVVSVESGVGWIPFFLESLNYQLAESAPGAGLSLTPLEYFNRQVYACFWFERATLAPTLEALDHRHILFESDFPHPTCLYPDTITTVTNDLAHLSPDVLRDLLQDNATSLYRIELPRGDA